ncbi:MAG TPA: hypothetical protein DD738_10520, partial [Ruminiclostridium sp.]|nr:hypothetical protein [Ruminiclostridium sp.]
PNMDAIAEKYGHLPDQQELYSLIKQEVLKANKKLSSYKKVRRFEVREEEFEKTTTKKIKRQVELVSLKAIGEMLRVFNNRKGK